MRKWTRPPSLAFVFLVSGASDVSHGHESPASVCEWSIALASQALRQSHASAYEVSNLVIGIPVPYAGPLNRAPYRFLLSLNPWYRIDAYTATRRLSGQCIEIPSSPYSAVCQLSELWQGEVKKRTPSLQNPAFSYFGPPQFPPSQLSLCQGYSSL